MKRLWTNYFFLFLISISFALALVTGCTEDKAPVTFSIRTNLPDEQADTVKLVSLNEAKTDWIIHAKHIDRFYDEHKTIAKNVIIDSYEKNGVKQATLTANNIVMNDIDNKLVAKGNVFIKSINGTLQTEELNWDRNTDLITSPVQVTLTRGQNVLVGYELQTTIKLDYAQMKRVSAKGKVDEKDLPR